MRKGNQKKQFAVYIKAVAVIVMALSILLSPLTTYCQNLSYEYLIELGEEHLNKGDYDEALHYFELAQIVNPSSKEAIYYFNLIKRLREGRVIGDHETISLEREVLIKKREDRAKQKKIYEEKRELLKEDVFQTLEKELGKIKEIEKKQEITEVEQKRKERISKELEALGGGGTRGEGREEKGEGKGMRDEGRRMRDEEKVQGSRFKAQGEEGTRDEARGTIETKDEGGMTLREYSGRVQDEGLKTKGEERKEKEEGKGEEAKVEEVKAEIKKGKVKDKGKDEGRGMRDEGRKIEDEVKIKEKDREKVKEEVGKKEEVKKEEKEVKKKVKETAKAEKEKIKIINLTPDMAEKFPMDVEVYLHDSFTVISQRGIKRFLVVEPEIISVERLDSSSIKITANEVGSTFLHVWDDQGRWTFSIKSKFSKAIVEEKRDWEEVEGFKFNYSMNWSSYYEGKDLGLMERKSLGFNESLNMRGPAPYGELGGSINWSKLGDKQEVTGYTAELNKGHLWQFNDFNIHGFDVSASLSSLTLPGKGLYGVIFNSMAFNKKIKYTILHGEEESSYGGGWLSPGTESKQKSYIEGLRLELLPEEKNSFYFNYAQGRGEGRQDYLKDKVVSLQSRHNWEDMSLSTEVASEGNHMAARLSSSLNLYDKVNLNLSLRDIEKDFVTITGKPSGSGEIGGTAGASCSLLENVSLSSNLDFYHDRDNFNEKNPQALNYNWDGSLGIKLDSKSSLSNSLYYTNTQGLSSPQRSVSGSTTYSRQFDFNFLGERSLSAYAGYNYQKSVYLLSESSGYRRDGLTSGLQLKLIGELSYYMNYDYSWVKELVSSDKSKTSVMTQGLSYSYSITPKLSSDFRLYYRNEEKNTTSTHAFLSGEDSVEGSMGLTYSASDDAEIFFDGRLRNSWPDSDPKDKTYNADVNLGVRLSWDSFFRWAPVTEITGVVFKDLNGDGIYDSNEEGIPQVRVIIGPKEAYTDEQGRFKTTVKTRSVVASLDVNTMPEGYIVTTPSSVDVNTSHGGRENVSFGLSSQSGIYGAVYYDINDNNKLDKKDIPIPGVKVTLDKKKIAVTNASGVYFFSNIAVGKHTVMLDVNSLPLEYIPKISVKKDVEITEGLTYTHHLPLKKR